VHTKVRSLRLIILCLICAFSFRNWNAFKRLDSHIGSVETIAQSVWTYDSEMNCVVETGELFLVDVVSKFAEEVGGSTNGGG